MPINSTVDFQLCGAKHRFFFCNCIFPACLSPLPLGLYSFFLVLRQGGYDERTQILFKTQGIFRALQTVVTQRFSVSHQMTLEHKVPPPFLIDPWEIAPPCQAIFFVTRITWPIYHPLICAMIRAEMEKPQKLDSLGVFCDCDLWANP